MATFGQHLDYLPRDSIASLDWLVGIGVGTEIDRAHAISGFGQFCSQQFSGIGFRKKFSLEIQARRQIQVRVRRSRKTIDASTVSILQVCSHFLVSESLAHSEVGLRLEVVAGAFGTALVGRFHEG